MNDSTEIATEELIRRLSDVPASAIVHDLSEHRARFGNGPAFGPIFTVPGTFHVTSPNGEEAPELTFTAFPSHAFKDVLNPSKPEVITVGWFRAILDRYADDDVFEIEADGKSIQRIAVSGAREGGQR